MPDFVPVHCPYCGEPIELAIDASAGPAGYVEDCPVCCRPMQVEVTVTDGQARASVRTGDE